MTRLMVAAAVALVALAALTGSVVLRIHDQNQLDRIARETHSALCAFKSDLEERARSQEQYLRDLRAGRREPIVGISENDIEVSLAARRATLAALAGLRCQ